MSSGASRSEPIRANPRQYLDARDAREALLRSLIRRARESGAVAVVWVSVGIPGPDKQPAGVDAVFASGTDALTRALPDSTLMVEGVDLLGPYRAVMVPAGVQTGAIENRAAKESHHEADAPAGRPRGRLQAAGIKLLTVGLEESVPAGRLLDLDVYDVEGLPVDRARLALPERSCLVCPSPARECIRQGRHAAGELDLAVAALLRNRSS
jgi:holo-ACP synthase